MSSFTFRERIIQLVNISLLKIITDSFHFRSKILSAGYKPFPKRDLSDEQK